jgi:hypothetical protein
MEASDDKDMRDRTIDLLKLEYEVSRSLIDKLDSRLFIVRNWAITTTGAIVALSLTVDQPRVLIVGAVAALFFAYLE